MLSPRSKEEHNDIKICLTTKVLEINNFSFYKGVTDYDGLIMIIPGENASVL